MATIKDVAQRAGVGIATVSRLLNGTGYVSADARRRIEEAIEALSYIPNERARNLPRKKAGIVGVIIPDLQMPFYASFIRQVEIDLHEYGYKTMVCNTVEISDREKEYVDMLERSVVDGIITGALSVDETVYQQIDRPIVSMDHDLGPDIPLIHSDHGKGGRLAAERLLRQGCKNVLQIGGLFPANTPSNDRYLEFERVMKERGVQVRTLKLDWNCMDYSYYREIFESHKEEIAGADGVFASDMGALALCHFASGQGIRVPEELKIIAYDGTDMTRLPYPVLTAVCQDIPLLARNCVDTIMRLIQGGDGIAYRQTADVFLQEGGTG